MAKHFPDLALRAAKEGLSHEAYAASNWPGRRKPCAKSDGRNGCYALRACRWRKPSGPLISNGSRLSSSFRSSGSSREPSWSRLSTSSPWENQVWGKVTCWLHLGMSSYCLVMPSYGRPPAPSCNGSSPPNGTCACPRNWQSWTNMRV